LRLLLDTHTAIWALAASRTLPERIRDLIGNKENQIFVSVVSLWEIGIKFSLYGRYRMPMTSREAVGHFHNAGYAMLDVNVEHALAVETIRLPRGDPFDRLILAQALSEPMFLVTKDRQLAGYNDTVVSW
jgi:PIN domain nuclease of toxin-antitoxin system